MGTINNTTVTHKGVKFLIGLEPDTDSSPDDADCYDDADKAEFAAGNWQYVGVIVTPIVGDIEWHDAQSGIWAVEYGHNGDVWTSTMDSIAQRAIDEGWCDEAADNLRKIATDVIAALSQYVNEPA
jgi:hypothetical protein